jgi:RHS repeat-associated protein
VCRGPEGPYNFDGKIDDVQIFDRALSATEIGWLHGLSYDKNGNLASDGLLKYYYDCENRLMEVTDANDDAVASYRYDFAGRRVSKTVGGVTTKYVYDGDQVIAEYNGSDTLLRKFVYGPGIDEPICMHRTIAGGGAGLFYYHYDGLGSVVALSDSSGDVVETYRYDVFGEVTIRDANETVISGSAVGNPYFFTGRRLDPETGLYYYRARYYYPKLGRFLQTDPIGYYGGLNLYTYCLNNPLNWIDPWGFQYMPLSSPPSSYVPFRDSHQDVGGALEGAYHTLRSATLGAEYGLTKSIDTLLEPMSQLSNVPDITIPAGTTSLLTGGLLPPNPPVTIPTEEIGTIAEAINMQMEDWLEQHEEDVLEELIKHWNWKPEKEGCKK